MTGALNGANGRPPVRSGRGIHPLASLRRHRVLALLLFLAIVGAGLPLAYWKGRPYYYSECVIYISPNFLKNLQEDREIQFQSNSQYREFVQQNARTMNRYDIVYEALQRLGQKRFVWQLPSESDRRAAERLQGALSIQPVPDTYQVTIGLEGTKPDGLADIVNTVADVYLKKERGEDFYATDQRVANLQQERNRLQSEIEGKEAERARISQSIAVSSFTDSFENPYDKLIAGAKESLFAARQKRYESESQLAAVDSAEPGSRAALAAMALDQATHDSALISLESNLNQRRGLLLTQISGLAPAHPGRKSIEREIAELDRQLKDRSDELVAQYGRALLDQRRAAVYTARRVEEALAADVARESARAAEFSSQYQHGLALGHDIETARKRLEAIDDRVGFLTLESDAPGFARIFAYARPAEVPVRSTRRKLFLLFCAAGLLLALAVPIAVDYADPRIHSAEDIESVLGFSPLAWVAERRDASPEFFRDQLLRIAAGLHHDAEAAGTRLVAITSAAPGAGATTLCLETAAELTRMGSRALAVEANAFKPDASYAEGPSLSELLSGAWAALHFSHTARNGSNGSITMPTLAVGTAKGERHVTNLKELRPALERAAAGFDVIVCDAPPLLLSADAEFLVRSADLVLLVVEAEVTTKAALSRAARRLESLRPKAVGVILNRVRLSAARHRAALEEFESGKRHGDLPVLSHWLWK